MAEHNTLTDPELHEPKGVAAANSGEVYIADGAASGAWTRAYQYGELETMESDSQSISSIGTTAQTLAFVNDGQSAGNITPDAATNKITLGDAGHYLVFFNITFSTAAAGDAGLYEFKLVDDGVATGFGCARQMSGSSDTGTASFMGIINVGAGSEITVEVESDEAGGSDDINVYTSTLTALKLV